MWLGMKKRYSLDHFEKEEDRRLAQVLLAMVLVYWACSLIMLLMDIFLGDQSLTVFLLLSSAMQGLPLYFLFQKKLTSSSFTTIAIYIGFTTLFTTNGQGLRDYGLLAYPAIILFAGLAERWRGLWISTLMTLVALVWLVAGEINGWFMIKKLYSPTWPDLMAAEMLILVTALAVYLLISHLEHSVTQTRRELAERVRVEEVLKESREDFQRYFNMNTTGMAVSAPDKGWIEVNDRLCVMLGYSREELTQLTWDQMTYPDDLQADLQLFQQVLAGQSDGYHMEKRFIRKDQSVLYTHLSTACHRHPDASVRYFLTSLTDITAQKQSEEALRQSREMYRLLTERVSDVIWILDLQFGRFRYVSPSVQRLRGLSAEEVLAQNIGEALMPASLAMLVKKLPIRLQAYEQGQQNYYVDELEQPCKDGSTIWTETTTSFHSNETNGHLEVYGVSRDITERKHNEAMLNLRLKLLELAAVYALDAFLPIALDEISLAANSTIGFFHMVNADQKTLTLQGWSGRTQKEFCTAHGKAQHYPIDEAGVWVDCLHERKPVIHNDYAALPHRKGLPPGHAQVQRELLVPVLRSGQVTCILGVGNKASDYNEREVETVAYLADVMWEITHRKQTEQALHEVEARLHLLGENLEEAGLYVYAHDADNQPHFEYLSASMEKLSGVKTEEVLRSAASIHAIILPEYLPKLTDAEAQSKQRLTSFELEIRQRHAQTGEIRWMLLRSTPRRRSDGSTVWYGVQIDINERKKNEWLLKEVNRQLTDQMEENELLQAELREQAMRDPLTGLYNRRYLNETLKRELARTQREQKTLSVIIMDIDHFKAVNDTYGHPVGDKLLIEIAEILTKRARASDIACRYGGEEFLLVLTGTSITDAYARAEELRQACADIRVPYEDQQASVTISMGIASYPEHGQQAEEILSKADRALYRSKQVGRNCVTVWVG